MLLIFFLFFEGEMFRLLKKLLRFKFITYSYIIACVLRRDCNPLQILLLTFTIQGFFQVLHYQSVQARSLRSHPVYEHVRWAVELCSSLWLQAGWNKQQLFFQVS